MTRIDPAALEAARAALIQLALEEDLGEGDWTSQWTMPAARRSMAVIVAKEPMIIAGGDCVTDVFRALDPSLSVDVDVEDGTRVEAGAVVARLAGRTRSILAGERTALNFLGRLSGIATETRRFVDAVSGTGARVLDTRKTTPGWRLLEKAAVRAGGAENHRLGLYDMVLVKDTHADASNGVAEAARAARAHNDRGLAVEVEVRSLDELEAVLEVGVDRILLDNLSPEQLRAAVARVRSVSGPQPELEASGNVTLDNIRGIAATGVDLVSVGALTHSARSADLSLRIVA